MMEIGKHKILPPYSHTASPEKISCLQSVLKLLIAYYPSRTESFLSKRHIIDIMQFQVAIARNCQALTQHMHIIYVVGYR
jgi:hypothetical protein